MLIPSLVKCQEEVFILKTKTKTKNKNKEKNKKNPDRSPFLLKNHASYFLRNGHTVGRRLNLSHMNVICTFSFSYVADLELDSPEKINYSKNFDYFKKKNTQTESRFVNVGCKKAVKKIMDEVKEIFSFIIFLGKPLSLFLTKLEAYIHSVHLKRLY